MIPGETDFSPKCVGGTWCNIKREVHTYVLWALLGGPHAGAGREVAARGVKVELRHTPKTRLGPDNHEVAACDPLRDDTDI